MDKPFWGSLKEMTYEQRARDFLGRMDNIPSHMVEDGVLQVRPVELYAALYTEVPERADRAQMLTVALQNAGVLFSERTGRWVLRVEVIELAGLLAKEARSRGMDETDLDRAAKVARILL